VNRVRFRQEIGTLAENDTRRGKGERKMFRKWMAVCFAGVLLAALFACATPAGRSAGQVIDDSAITTKVKALMLEDGVMKTLAVSVSTFNGRVTLTGAVDSAAQKTRAEEIARGVAGVTGVNNLLEIKKP
jgi:hyperosmotically inducible periplasmic protein